MTRLGEHLKALRLDAQRSSRWVERRSKTLFPADEARQISHTYLRHIEEGRRPRPSPPKLEALARIYDVEYRDLLRLAGYLSDPPGSSHVTAGDRAAGAGATAGATAAGLEAAARLVHALERHGVNPAYFMNNLSRLEGDSLLLVTRLVSSLVVQEGAKRQSAAETDREEAAGQQAPPEGTP